MFPKLTPLQSVILSIVKRHKGISGTELRKELLDRGISLFGPAFYQLMGRISGPDWIEQETILSKERKRETYYSITKKGLREFQETLSFCSRLGE